MLGQFSVAKTLCMKHPAASKYSMNFKDIIESIASIDNMLTKQSNGNSHDAAYFDKIQKEVNERMKKVLTNVPDDADFPYQLVAEFLSGQKPKLYEDHCLGNYAMHAATSLLLVPLSVHEKSRD
jgi:hypothetical protein